MPNVAVSFATSDKTVTLEPRDYIDRCQWHREGQSAVGSAGWRLHREKRGRRPRQLGLDRDDGLRGRVSDVTHLAIAIRVLQ